MGTVASVESSSSSSEKDDAVGVLSWITGSLFLEGHIVVEFSNVIFLS